MSEQTVKLTRPKLVPIDETIENKRIECINDDEYNNVKFVDCSFISDDAEYVTFKSAVFKNCDFKGTRFYKAEFSDIRFENCDLSNVELNEATFHRAEFVDCRMTGIRLMGATISQALFQSCLGTYLNMNLASLKYCFWDHCFLSNASFQESKWFKVEANETDFRGCQFSGTSLKSMDFSESNIEGICVQFEDIRGMVVSPVQAMELAKLLEIVIKE